MSLTNCNDVDFISIRLTMCQTNFTIGVIYRPPDQNLSLFNDAFNALLARVSSEKHNRCFFAGDFNINLLNHDTHADTADFLNNIFAHYYYPTITRPTRFCATNSTLIDNIFTNNISEDFLNGIIVSEVSDHLPVFYILKEKQKNKFNTEYKTLKYRDINEINIVKFSEKLAEFNQSQDTGTLPEDVNKCYDNFINPFKSLYNQYFPLVTKRIKIKRNNYKPWITPAIVKSISRKNHLYKTWLKLRTESSHEKFKKYKNKLVHIIRSAEKNYYAFRFKEKEGNIKETWKIIKSMINSNIKSNDITEICDSSTIINDPEKIVNKFNDFFVNVGKSLANKIPATDGNYRDYLKHNILEHSGSLFLDPVDSDEILNIINSLQSNKAAGYDEISPKVIKATAYMLARPLANIFNMSLTTGVFPDGLKIAKVSPIFKANDKLQVSNYRPISVLPVFSKTFEKLIFNTT